MMQIFIKTSRRFDPGPGPSSWLLDGGLIIIVLCGLALAAILLVLP